MRKILLIGLFGLLAQLIDGSLGMAYGVTTTTLLLTAGTAPAIASATVHMAEVGTTLASGTAHWRFGNVDWRTVGIMAVPGFIGAFVGAVVLSSLSAEAAEPWVAAFLFLLGVYILVRFTITRRQRSVVDEDKPPLKARFLAPLGAVGGTLDAMGGGGWGPIGTSSLLSSGRLEPRKVVGSIDTSEFVVAVGASIGFLFALSLSELSLGFLAALLVGGLIAAPIAAFLVKMLPARVLGTAAGGLILMTNARTFGEAVGVPEDYMTLAYAVLAAVWLGAVSAAVVEARRNAEIAVQPA